MGLFAILAIAARGALTLVGRVQALQRDGGEALDAALVLRAARERLAPIVTTALAVAAAFLPILIAGDRAGLEVVRPMAGVILGGLVTSTLVTLFAIPVACLVVGPVRERDETAELIAQPELGGA
jgi:Cu/Ag efflux pump CusA